MCFLPFFVCFVRVLIGGDSISGNKTVKARSWSIPIVNHIWLEDRFTQWGNLTVSRHWTLVPHDLTSL